MHALLCSRLWCGRLLPIIRAAHHLVDIFYVLRINLAATTVGVASLTKELVAAYHKPPVWGCSQG